LNEKMARALELFEKLKNVEAIATDLDGTLTENRQGYRIPVEVIEGMSLLRKAGVKIFFVSANSFPIVYGLARYLGADGAVAENGCFVSTFEGGTKRPYIVEPCKDAPRDVAKLIAERLPNLVRESWQNEFRKHDFALELIGGAHNAKDTIKEIKRILSDEGLFERIELNYSGYAVHISPKGAGKLAGLKYLLSMQGINISRVAGIGDSAMDWDFIRETGIKVAVSNADEELKEKSDIITDYESGFGFAQLCKAIAEAKFVKDQR